MVALYGGEVWDYRQTDTTFQSIVAQTASDGDTEPVGYALGIGRWDGASLVTVLAAQTEQFPTGADGNPSDWTAGSNHALSTVSGQLRVAATNTGFTNKAFATDIGELYRVASRMTPVSGATSQFHGVRKADNSGASVNPQHLNSFATVSGYGSGVLGASFYVATASTSYLICQVNGPSALTVDFDDFSHKKIPSYEAVAPASGNRPVRQSDGAIRFATGTSTSLLTRLTAGSAGTLLCKATMGASGAAKTLIGAGAGASNGCVLMRASDGRLAARLGAQDETTIVGGADISAVTGVAALRWDGSRVRLDWFPTTGGHTVVYDAAQSGSPGSVAFRIGATNEGGTAAAFGDDAHFMDVILPVALSDAELASTARGMNLAENVLGVSLLGGFQIFDAMGYAGKPSLIAQDMMPVLVVNSQQGAADPDEPYEYGARKSGALLQAMGFPSGYPAVVNIESWETDFRKLSGGASETVVNRQKLEQVFNWHNPYTSGLALGLYRFIPSRDYWTPVQADETDINEWQQANDLLEPLVGTVRALYPSLYTFYSDQDGWLTYARANIAEARRISKGLPIYPFIWPQYHDSNAEIGGTFLPGDYWALQLQTIYDEGCDGVIIWSPGAPAWNNSAEWWVATQAFLSSLTAPTP